MNSLVTIRPNRRQPKRTWGDRVYVPTAPVRIPVETPDTRPNIEKVSDAILAQLARPATKVVTLYDLPYLWETREKYADTHIWVAHRLRALPPNPFANMFYIGKAYPEFGIVSATRADVLRLYEQVQLLPAIANDRAFRQSVAALSGKVLVCHEVAEGRILARLADKLNLLQ